MKKVIAASVVSIALLSALTACGSSDSKSSTASTSPAASTAPAASAAAASGNNITVTASNFKFAPNEIHVKKGDKVTIKLDSTQGMHGLSAAALGVDLKKSGDTATFTADKAGTFDFICSIMCGAGHADMKGKIVVE